MNPLYDFCIQAYGVVLKLASPFHPKAEQWIEGRRDIFHSLSSIFPVQHKVAWFHAASLGEFEQGRPVIEAFRKEQPDYKILLTFFSPSGYEIRKHYAGADWVFYLPLDTYSNAKKFIELVQPNIAVFIKYEFWFNYLKELHRHQTPTYIISSIFRPQQHFFKWYGSWFRKQLKKIDWFFVQNQQSHDLLQHAGIAQVSISGDTRFDRVWSVANNAREFTEIEAFCHNHRIFLAGSSWPTDEEHIAELIKKDLPGLRFIIAPHEVHEEHIQQIIRKTGPQTVRFSSVTAQELENARVLIIDSIGKLLHLYQYADIAYIGGGFGKGIHNILEAATFGVPVIFGPNHHKFQEAVDLTGRGGAFSFQTSEELFQLMEKLGQNDQAGAICKKYVEEKRGATNIILQKLQAVPAS